MQSQRTEALKVTKIPLAQRCIAVLEATCAKVSRGEKLRPRSYLGPDGAGWSFQKFFDVRKSLKTIRTGLPHNMDFGFQAIPGDFINFVLFWPGCDPRGITFPIQLLRGDAVGAGVKNYGDLVLEIARCYDAFFRFYRQDSLLPRWNVKTNPHYMVENLGLLEIRHAGANVFYAYIEYQSNILVPTAPAHTPSTTFVPSTVESVMADPIFEMPDEVRSKAEKRLESFTERFPYPSEEQSTRLAAALGYDVTLIKLWFEGKRGSVNTAKIAPQSRLRAALASLK
ncbi:hypothetical protein V8D89_007920 [Ganoderma adspersum]